MTNISLSWFDEDHFIEKTAIDQIPPTDPIAFPNDIRTRRVRSEDLPG